MRIALTGNPNSGKTTMYNALTGRNERVGNWAGVTVEKKEHPIKKAYYGGEEQLIAVDLPGAYSMSPFTSEESITSSYVKKEHPDVIINIVDATNMSRSLFFTKLGCPVIQTVSTSNEGLKAVVEAAAAQAGRLQEAPYREGDIDLTDKKVVEAADRKRFDFVNGIVAQVEKRKVFTKDKNSGDSIDAVLTKPWLGIPIFAVVMFLVFQISQVWVGPYIADALVAQIENFQGWVGELVADANPLLSALLVDGIIGGVGAVVGFLPLVMVMYFLIALLEDCGYMSRVAVVLDPIFKKVGLSGKSVIPFVIGIGCGIPGVMACRTIRNERERRATAMLTTFMPCGAKIPVITLIAGAFFDNAGWVSFLMYVTGIVLIFLGALLVNVVTGYKVRKSFFIIELPEYKLPSLWFAFKSMCSRGWAYIVKAATIILLCNTVVQIMQTFNWSFQVAETADSSILASIAAPFAVLLVPIVGVLSWQLAAAAVTGFIAKENVVGTLAVCFVGLENFINVDELAMVEGAGADVAAYIAITPVAALAYLMFNLYTPPCFAAIGAMNSEMKSTKWVLGGIGLQLCTGYTVAYLVYTIGTLITAPALLNVSAAIGGLIGIIVMISVVVTLARRANRHIQEEYRLDAPNTAATR